MCVSVELGFNQVCKILNPSSSMTTLNLEGKFIKLWKPGGIPFSILDLCIHFVGQNKCDPVPWPIKT